MEKYRITIRNPDVEMVNLIREVASENSMTLGQCFNDAISIWYESLPIVDPIEIDATDYYQ